MHATIPALPHGIHQVLRTGINLGDSNNQLAGLFNRAEGKLLANGMAVLIKLGFGFLT